MQARLRRSFPSGHSALHEGRPRHTHRCGKGHGYERRGLRGSHPIARRVAMPQPCRHPLWRRQRTGRTPSAPIDTSGRGGIRTHGTLSRTHTFQACALNHSATRPTNDCRPAEAKRADGANRRPSALTTARTSRSGQGEIRTHGTVAGTPVFETGAFNHSATCPGQPENLARAPEGCQRIREPLAALGEEIAQQRAAFRPPGHRPRPRDDGSAAGGAAGRRRSRPSPPSGPTRRARRARRARARSRRHTSHTARA